MVSKRAPEPVQGITSTIFISMLASVSFGVIDGINFLLIEDHLTNFWKKFDYFDDETITLLNGGISAALSIIIAVILEKYLEHYYTLFKHPLIDASGIIIGTVLVLLIYKLYQKYSARIKKT